MEIREATEEDIPAIVDLLKISLGESLMPKSEEYWRWKHINNPFGPSPVLLCWEKGQLIGVRAFMRWQWVQNGRVYRAVRAVDTATHPDHQGKGIFRKLTLALLDSCKNAGDDFVFNTPNEKSKPGYLKMGWQEAGKLPIEISPWRPIRMLSNLLIKKITRIDEFASDITAQINGAGVDSLLEDATRRSDSLVTNATIPYLKWRYADVPVANYFAISHGAHGRTTGLLFGRLKKTRFGTELRVTDCFASDLRDLKSLADKFKTRVNELAVDYLTASALSNIASGPVLKSALTLSFGPTVTIRALALEQLDDLHEFHRWRPSLGDLELF